MTRARLTVDLDALARNHATLRKEAGGATVAPVLKADGYGLGAAAAGRRLWTQGARSFFVARLHEAEKLREALGLERPATIYVLDGLAGAAPSRFTSADLTPVLNSTLDIDGWRGVDRPAALHVDTGMNRLGVVMENLDAAGGLPIAHVMSHLACAAEPANPRNRRQLELFRTARACFPAASASLACARGSACSVAAPVSDRTSASPRSLPWRPRCCSCAI